MAGMGVDRRTMLAAIAAGVVAAVTRPPVAGAVRLMVPLARVPAPVGVLFQAYYPPTRPMSVVDAIEVGNVVPIVAVR